MNLSLCLKLYAINGKKWAAYKKVNKIFFPFFGLSSGRYTLYLSPQFKYIYTINMNNTYNWS